MNGSCACAILYMCIRTTSQGAHESHTMRISESDIQALLVNVNYHVLDTVTRNSSLKGAGIQPLKFNVCLQDLSASYVL